MIEKETALNYLVAGLAVLPADKTQKRPTMAWKDYQERRPTECEVNAWFCNQHDAICLVCGKTSGNLEVIDFDNHGELFDAWQNAVPTDLESKLVIETTPSGGFHVAYRCEDAVSGNTKLAQGVRNDKTATLIETRGEGGLILCAPSDGYTLTQGDYTALPILTAEERDVLLNAAKQLNEIKEEEHFTQPVIALNNFTMYEPDYSHFEKRPGDEFNERINFGEMLTYYGWKLLRTLMDGTQYWQRPGKDGDQHSATLKDGIFYVFSSNAAPFEPNKGYTAFSAFVLLRHNGDFGKAAADLLAQGFGQPKEVAPDVDLSVFLKNIGAKTAEENTESEPPKREKRFFNALDLLQEYHNMKEPLIEGLLRREEVMNIVAAPKTGKSWFVLQLALAFCTGTKWAGVSCTKGKVLLIDNELHKETISKRIRTVAYAMGIPEDCTDLGNLNIYPQRGDEKDLRLIASTVKQETDEKFDVIIIDALYKALPKDVDENSNGQITDVYSHLDRLARSTGAAVILVHHTSKGNQANKSVTDVGSGAGAQSRAPDTHLTLRPHKEKGVVSVNCCVRSFPPVDPFCLCRDENNLWSLAPEYDPAEMEGKEGKRSEEEIERKNMDTDAIMVSIRDNIAEFNLPLPKTALINLIHERLGAMKTRVTSAVECLITENFLEIRKGDPKKHQQAMKCICHGPESPFYKEPDLLDAVADEEQDNGNKRSRSPKI